VEVLFRKVAAIKAGMELDELTIRDPSASELMTISQQIGSPAAQIGRVFVIETSTWNGYIVASEFATAEDDGDYKTPSSLLIEA